MRKGPATSRKVDYVEYEARGRSESAHVDVRKDVEQVPLTRSRKTQPAG